MKSSSVDNLSLVLQALSLQILFQDYNNSDLMNELQHQNRDYLEKIIEQNNKIIEVLNERRDIDAREIGKENRGKY